MRKHYAVGQTVDIVIGRRIFTVCWLSAGLGVSILQMRLLAQAWDFSQHAIMPACIASAWVIGSLFASRLQNAPRMWGASLLAGTLLWIGGPRHVSWQLDFVPSAVIHAFTLVVIALLLGAIGTAWLFQRRPWPAVGEWTSLVRGLVGTTAGLCTVWVFPTWAALIALVCVLPLLVLDYQPADRRPLPGVGGVLDSWVGRYWNPEQWQLQLDRRCLPRDWRWSYLAGRSQGTGKYVPLSLLASSVAVLVGSIWGAVPTPFAAGLVATHELGKLGWLLGSQIVILAGGALCLRAARSWVGFPDRLLPPFWRSRALLLALSMLAILGGSLGALGLPFLQAPWWLALSLATYTLAGAVWGILLPRLRPGLGTVVFAQRHLWPGQGQELASTLQLAHGRAQEERVKRLDARTEGLLIALLTPLVGWLIDSFGSVDRILVIAGLSLLLWLLLVLLSARVSILIQGVQCRRTQVSHRVSPLLAGNSLRVATSTARLA